jgi:hypothetical protein
MNMIRIQWSETQPIIDATNPEELENALDRIASQVRPDHPMIIFINAHGYRVIIGVGYEESFLQFESESGDPPYIATVGDPKIQGAVPFYLFGDHHTEIRRRNLIPTARARAVLTEWITTAIRPIDIEWEEI